MRGSRSFLVLLVFALGLGAYIYLVESKRDLTDPATKHDRVFTVDAAKIEELDVKAASGEETKLKKNGDKWQIVSGDAGEADPNAVSTLAVTLGSLDAQSVVDEHPASVAPFGLEPARYSVAFRLEGDANMHRLDVGTKTPNGADVYARVEGQPKVVLISASNDDSLNRTTFDLRDKSILKLPLDGADAIKIDVPGAPAVALAKKGADWRLTAPVEAKADFTAVDGVVGQVTQAKMKSMVATIPATGLSAADLKKYGLDKPQILATIGAGSAHAELAIGAKVGDGKPAETKVDPKAPPPPPAAPETYYARDLSRPMVFTVEKTLVDSLKKKADDLRSKDLFEFRSFSAVGVDLMLGNQAFTFAKQKVAAPAAPPTPPATPPAAAPDQPAPTDVWKETKPSDKDVNQTALTDLLTNLSNLRADKFAEHALTSGEDLVVTARFGDPAAPKEERVTFRKSGTVVQAIRAGEPGAAIVPTADYEKALAGFKELAGIK